MFNFLFGAKANAVYSLFTGSFKLLGEENVRALLFSRLYFSLIMHGLALVALAMVSFHFHTGWGVFLLVILLLVIYPYSFFYHIRARARQTWFAYAKITQHADPITEAGRMVAKQKWTLRLFAVVELFLSNADSQQSNQQGGLMRFLVATALAALDGIYKIAESYLLPAVVIERLSLENAAQKLRQLKDHIPSTLAGSFGLDIFGGVVSSVVSLLYLALLALGASLAWFLPQWGLVSQNYTITLHGTAPAADVYIFVFPVLCALVLASTIRRAIKIVVTSLQATYFAIFYTRLNFPDAIAPDMRGDVEGYLQAPAADGGATNS